MVVTKEESPWSVLPLWIPIGMIIMRILVGLSGHSGEGEDHNLEAAYGGDYEAQRHWMELTIHLPIQKWYFYDPSYWGLDYPPLTAYYSYLCGLASHYWMGSETVALFDSRGYEEAMHKVFMRWTVLLVDCTVYFTSVIALTWRLSKRFESNNRKRVFVCMVLVALAQPGIILIDHGHFQYNTMSLGLALWSFHFMTVSPKSFFPKVIGAFLFCMALNFKQMTLYYAPAVFSFLLGKCCAVDFFKRFSFLGITVIFSFALLWWPFYFYADAEVGGVQSLMQVMLRLFPFQRGLFEGKVANIWCALSVKPLSLRKRIPQSAQPILALLLTLSFFLPACYKTFIRSKSRTEQKKKIVTQDVEESDLRLLLLSTSCSALAFFLASFQVHEKSILIALSPLSLLFVDYPNFISWFCVLTTWTMYPLFTIDKLESTYFINVSTFLVIVSISKSILFEDDCTTERTILPEAAHRLMFKVILPFTNISMVCLHVIECLVEAPTRLPDLFPVIWSIIGCGLLFLSFTITTLLCFKDEFVSKGSKID